MSIALQADENTSNGQEKILINCYSEVWEISKKRRLRVKAMSNFSWINLADTQLWIQKLGYNWDQKTGNTFGDLWDELDAYILYFTRLS